MAVLQRLNAGSFFLYSLLSVFIFLALVLKVCRNRFSCHGQSVAEPVPSKLSNFGHSLKFMAGTRKGRVQTLATKRQRSSRSWRCAVEGWWCLWSAGANVPTGRRVVRTNRRK